MLLIKLSIVKDNYLLLFLGDCHKYWYCEEQKLVVHDCALQDKYWRSKLLISICHHPQIMVELKSL